jgi:hypothetical protein
VLISGVDISVDDGWEAAYPPNVFPCRHPRIASRNFVARGTLSSASAAASRVLTRSFRGDDCTDVDGIVVEVA